MADGLPELAPLAALANARRSVPEYYVPLTRSDDEIVRAAAWIAMCERNLLPYQLYRQCLAMCRHGAVKTRAFKYFERAWEREMAAEVAATADEPESAAQLALAEAQLRCSDADAAAACRALYLATGQHTALMRELDFLTKAGGPAAALPTAVRNVVINPHDPMSAGMLLQLCRDLERADLVDEVVSIYNANDLHPRLSLVFAAASRLLQRDPQGALEKLQLAGKARPTSQEVMNQLLRLVQRLNAQTQEALGNYKRAVVAYQELNTVVGGKDSDVNAFRRRMVTVARLDVPELPPEDRSNWFTMTGFPRSGTTLLENALAAHPRIETFEELPTRASMQFYIDRSLPQAKTADERLAVFVEGRRRYYDEMERRMAKPDAAVFIDKSPIRSADAGFMVKAFPRMRYVFSIRHPFDVVLSCFKQAFAPNMAMEGFRTFESAAAFYDFTMTQWFGIFGMDDPRVHYLKYDDLVTDFEPRMAAALNFLGVDWDDAVLEFATAAQSRASQTPSYQKVRQGLKIGIQTSWRKFGFLFDTPAAKPLYKWAEFFGYPAR